MPRFLPLLLLVGVGGMILRSPPHLVGDIRTPIFAKQIGDQNPHLNLTGQLALVRFGHEDCDPTDPKLSKNRGKIVLVTMVVARTFSIKEEEKLTSCVEQAGAIAMIRAVSIIREPGLCYYWSDFGLSHAVTIPLLHAVEKGLLLEVFNALDAGENVTATLHADENPWRTQMYDSVSFTIIMRGGVCLINLVGVAISGPALVGHFHRIVFQKQKFSSDRNRTTAWIMFGACGIELVSCAVRAVYFAMGPLISTTYITFQAHMMLVFSTMGIDMLTTVASVSLFLRWGAFGEIDSWFKRNLDWFLVFFGVLNFSLVHALGSIQGKPTEHLDGVLATSSIVLLLSLLVSALVFLTAGIIFIYHLRVTLMNTSSNAVYRTRCIQKAVRWITLSGAFMLVQVVGTGLISKREWFYDPKGQFAIFALIFYGVSCAGVSHAMAFRPIHDSKTSFFDKFEWTTRILRKMERVPTKESLANATMTQL